MEISEKVKKIAIENGLNRAQTRALQELQNEYSKKFQLVTNGGQNGPNDGKGPGSKVSAKIGLKDLSGREIGNMAEKAAKKEGITELNRSRVSPSFRLEMIVRDRQSTLI